MTPRGLYCAAGDFYLDPWLPVPRAVVTHAHSDHARPGSGQTFCAAIGERLLRQRFGPDSVLRPVPYRQRFAMGRAEVELLPAGHILGSAQIAIEAAGQRWIFSGDYKRDPDPTCEPFEASSCDVFVSEATFALPIYRWAPGPKVAADILTWWDRNRARGVASVLFCYALGKAQRVLGELGRLTERRIFTHGAVESLVECYRREGVKLPPTLAVSECPDKRDYAGELILAPPSAFRSPWLRRFGELETGFASGWMRIRGNRRRKGYDRGFTLSDHADWPSLVRTVKETGARRVLVTHGATDAIVRFLNEQGTHAETLQTGHGGERED